MSAGGPPSSADEPRPDAPRAAGEARHSRAVVAREARRARRRRDRERFDELVARTPRPWVTHVLGAVNLGVFVAMALAGVAVLEPDPLDVLAWGASFAPLVVVEDEWWRLATASFLHFGIGHLVANLWALWKFGPVVERLYGSAAFLVLCAASGVLAALASVGAYPDRICAGASGVVFGILGAGLVAWRRRRSEMSAALFLGRGELGCLSLTLAPWRLGGPAGVVYLVVMGLVDTDVSIAGHAGGLLAGILFGAQVPTRLDAPGASPGVRPWRPALAAAAVLLVAAGIRAGLLGNPGLHLALARLRADRGDHAGGLESAERALELDPSLAAAREHRDWCRAKLDGRDPRAALQQSILAMKRMVGGDCEAGRADLARAAELDGDSVDEAWGRRWYADCLARAGRVDEALTAFAEILAVDGRDAQVLQELAVLHHRRGDWRASLDEFLARIEAEPDDDCRLFAWTLRMRLGRAREAEANLRKDLAESESDSFARLGGFLLGEVSEDELLALEAPDADASARFRVLPPYLAATRRELDGDLAGARALYERVVAAEETYQAVHWMAGARLAQLETPSPGR